MAPEHDFELRQAAIAAVRELSCRYDDIVPVDALREGFHFRGERISFGSFYSGIFRPRQLRGPAALTLTTTPPKPVRDAPYDDGFDEETGNFVYHYRAPQSDTPQAVRAAEADNRALRAAGELGVPVIYFHGIARGQYTPVAPVFVIHDDPGRRLVELQAALPVADLTEAGLTSNEDVRRYATREALVRLHQHRFRTLVLHAYRGRCAVCALRETALVQAAHILEDRDPRGVVHISQRVLRETDGPMLRTGLQGFHGAAILQPRRTVDRPDPERLEVRYERFRAVA